MARILDFFLDKKTNSDCASYRSHAELFGGLEREEPGAIRCLTARISGSVYKIAKKHQLTDEDVEELICDCVTLCLQKIKAGKYVFQGYDPATYAIEIAKNKAHNYYRQAVKYDSVDLSYLTERIEIEDFTSLADTDLLEKLLTQLDENCQNLIRLKYLDENRDKDLIERKMTQYTTVDALKNKRANCMKKLVELASNASLLNR